ncbi:MAG: hypothetical protein K2X37_14125 [Chitinophagaceae bacterium]|nr:hypothetical protein [Chitinophagaceae bacterium]
MKNYSKLWLFVAVVATLSSCSKLSDDNNDIYKYIPPPAVPISDAAPLCGSIKGRMLTGKTYTVGCDVFVNEGDSLIIEPGVRVNFTNSAGLIVKGNFFSLGTKENPIWLTVSGQTKTDNPQVGYSASKDSAFAGKWKGVIGDITCKYLIFKWTHVEYTGALLGAGGSSAYATIGLTASDASYAVYASNGAGYFVFEDSWVYGTTDDAIRVGGGGSNFAILRSTFEKCGRSGGDVLNVKAGAVGDMAYNFFIGNATNALKAANSGNGPGIANCEVNIYNNTLVNGGYRQTKTGRGGSINFENGARGKCFNNLIVNCKFGLRLNTNVPDTTYMYANNYGYNYYWADSLSVANQIFPYTPGSVTKPVATDFPNPLSYLPANYAYRPNVAYNGQPAVQVGNPLFFNYPLPVTGGYYLQDITAKGNFKFNLTPGSPCIGKGYTNFQPLQKVPVDPIYGVTQYSFPGVDIGAYQSNGLGNSH